MGLRFVIACLTLVSLAGSRIIAEEVALTILPDRILNRVDEKIYGHFLEHIFHSCNGGLWGELVWDRSFEGGAGAVWTFEDGAMVQDGVGSDVRTVFGAPTWTDYELIVEARKIGGEQGVIVLLRADKDQQFYWINFGGWGGFDKFGHFLQRRTKGQRRRAAVTGRHDGKIEMGRWYQIRARCEGKRIQAWLDDELVIDYTDDGKGPRRGGVGIGSSNTQVQFRGVKVTSLDGRVLHEGLPPEPAVDRRSAPIWRPFGSTRVSTETRGALNGSRCKRIDSPGGIGGLAQQPLCIRAGEVYRGSLWARGKADGGIVVRLSDGTAVLAEQFLAAPTATWQELPVALTPSGSSDHGTLQVAVRGPGTVWLDQVSLMPESWRQAGGCRPDLLQAVAQLRPPVIRWPGGCFASPYRWKDAIGPQHKRRPHPRMMWDDKEVNSFGTDEFIAMCRRVGAEPVIVVNIGTPAWNREVMDNDFLQEALDWIEYCNGPADSKWGKVRAANGHPEPYGVKYWEIDNETWHEGVESYAKSVNRFASAMRQTDPMIKLAACGSAGYGDEGIGLEWNRILLGQCAEQLEYLSIHHYENPQRFAEGPRAYEDFFRRTAELIAQSKNPQLKIYVSEWNSQSTDWRTGLYCGGLLNAFERCGSFLEMGGPALFLRHVSADAWDNAFINFDHRSWFPAPNYVVMKLWRDHYAPQRVTFEGETGPLNVVATRSSDGKRLCFKAVNPAEHPVSVKLTLGGGAIATSSMEVLAPGSLLARNTLNAPDVVRPAPLHVTHDGRSVRFNVPAIACGIVTIHCQ
jgi:alpha-N-arabinofuranosidase